jgi:hypothetical protein
MNIKHISLISHYTSILKNRKIEFDIIYIDKYGEDEVFEAKNKYVYRIDIDKDWNRIKKLSKYLGFRKFVKNIIKENDYDLLIVWRTETALLLSDIIYKLYRKKYIINIRDYCYEKNFFIKVVLKKILANSKLNTISSEGFYEFLPKSNYLMLHSYNESLLKDIKPRNQFKKMNEPIRVCFIGYVRFYDVDKKLIDELGNDDRYIIQFFGQGSDVLREYCEEKNITNVEFHGRFNVEDTIEFLSKADVINNLYGFNNIALDTAISTKYYYALHMNIPILVFKGTYMEEITLKSGVGYAVDSEFESLGDSFYKWYHKNEIESFKRKCSNEIDRIKSLNTEFINKFNTIIDEGIRGES